MSRYTKSYFLSRLAIGASMFGHGLVRLPKLGIFSNGIALQFRLHGSIVPTAMVVPFCYVLPFAEFLIGLFLLIGFFTEEALIAGAIVMILLIFGSTTIEEWDAVPSQLIHVAFFVVLLAFIEHNSCTLDTVLRRKKV